MRRSSISWSRPTIFCVSIALILLLPTSGCNDKNPTTPFPHSSDPAGILLSVSGCKQLQVLSDPAEPSPDEDCVQYEYDGTGILTLKHMNAGFNCCPGEISADIDIENHVITVTEHEAEYGCRCLCLFDVDYRIENLEPGEYEIVFVELCLEPGDEPLEFECDLSQAASGTCCVKRTHYPWNMRASGEASGSLLEVVGCKEQTGKQSDHSVQAVNDCIEYDYIQNNILLLKHINAGFNCCPVLDTDITIENGVIRIAEREIEGMCDCYCLFDFYYMIVNLPPGEYTITVDEHYVQKGDEKLEFTVDLVEIPSGIYCVERNHSPW